jgi:GT2 family glycosyltransferase
LQHNSIQTLNNEPLKTSATPLKRDLLFLLVCRPDKLLAACWWRLCGKKLRARYRLEEAIAALPFAHERWMARIGRKDLETVKGAGRRPRIGVYVDASQHDDIEAVLASCRAQSKPADKVIVTDHQGNFMLGLCAALEEAQEAGLDWLVPLAAQTTLPRHALAAYAAHILREDDNSLPTLIFGDEEARPTRWRSATAWYKPHWDRRMFLSQDYVSGSCALRVAPTLRHLQESKDALPASLYHMLLQLFADEARGEVQHVSRVTARTAEEAWQGDAEQRLAAVKAFASDAAAVLPGPFGTVRITWSMPEPAPKVSIIVPTRDRVELLRTCAEGVLKQTHYPDFELIVADNDSSEPQTLAYMEEIASDARVCIVRWPHPFNYSAINNFAARHARGEFLCLLNNDIEVIEPDWLSAMMREAVRPGVGAVGARLLYPDRTIQHAGVAIGIGNAAGHAHRGLEPGEPGYFAQALIARGASAVTAACLLVAKRHFDAVGGLDEVHLAVAYNDVDLCLKLQAAGLRNIYTPAATLIHHESKSRGLDFAPEHLERYMRELAVFQEKWGTMRVVDPWHHPQLDRAREIYAAGSNQIRQGKPV